MMFAIKNFFSVGRRTIKTVIAVFICFLIDLALDRVMGRDMTLPFFSTIAAVICVKENTKTSVRAAIKREIATIIGGTWGMAFMLFERFVWKSPSEILRCLILSLLLILLINSSVMIDRIVRRDKTAALACIVFLCITVSHGADENPIAFSLRRILDTTIGIAVALGVNLIPFKKKQERINQTAKI